MTHDMDFECSEMSGFTVFFRTTQGCRGKRQGKRRQALPAFAIFDVQLRGQPWHMKDYWIA